MKNLMATTEHVHGEYYRVCVTRADGTTVKGSRTLDSFKGRKLKQVVSDMQADIDAGLWDKAAERKQ